MEELVKLHGGNIHADSKLNVGSTFTVSLPLGAAHLSQDRIRPGTDRVSTALQAEIFVEEALRSLAESKLNAGAAPAETYGKPKILLADDNADMRQYVTRLLRDRIHRNHRL